jgi:hypothetical protein
VVTTTVAAANNRVGGLAGTNNTSGTISGSYAVGMVNAQGSGSAVGGLVGKNAGGVNNAYSMVVTSGTDSTVGGLAGENSGSIEHAFSVGATTGQNSTVGGLAGLNSGTFADSVWAINTSGQAKGVGSGPADGVQGLKWNDMLNSDNFAAWDTGVWGVTNGVLPYLKWQYKGTPSPALVFSGTLQGGSGQTVNAVYNGTQIGQGNVFGVNGFYYGVGLAESGVPTDGQMLLLYVTGDPNYKATGLYRLGGSGLGNGDLRRNTLIVDGGGTTVSNHDLQNALGANSALKSADVIYTYNVGKVTVNGDFEAHNYVLSKDRLLGTGGYGASLVTTGSITIDTPGDFIFNAGTREAAYHSPDNINLNNEQYITAGGDITITTGGSLIIKPGVLNYTELQAGGDITLVAKGGFVNYSGPKALVAGGRWLVYAPEQLIYSANTRLFYDARAYDYTLEFNRLLQWTDLAKAAGKSGELTYDARGGLVNDFTLWGTAYDPDVALSNSGNGFIFTAVNPAVRTPTPTQIQRRDAVSAAQSGSIRQLEPTDSAGSSQQSTEEDLSFLTILDGGVSI